MREPLHITWPEDTKPSTPAELCKDCFPDGDLPIPDTGGQLLAWEVQAPAGTRLAIRADREAGDWRLRIEPPAMPIDDLYVLDWEDRP